jgi:hypothetical protein
VGGGSWLGCGHMGPRGTESRGVGHMGPCGSDSRQAGHAGERAWLDRSVGPLALGDIYI